MTLFPYEYINTQNRPDELTQSVNARLVKETEAREQFAKTLTERFAAKHINVEANSTNDQLSFHFVKEGPKAARRDGLSPFDKTLLFKRVLLSNTEVEVCSWGFHTIVARRDDLPAYEIKLECPDTLAKQNGLKLH